MAAFPQFTRLPQRLCGTGAMAGAPAAWAAAPAASIARDELFTSTGLFGIKIRPAGTLADQTVELHGFMTPPILADADYFVLSRSPVPNCSFCVPAVSWPDNTVVVHLRAPGVDPDHSGRAVAARGILEMGENASATPALLEPCGLRTPWSRLCTGEQLSTGLGRSCPLAPAFR